MEACLKLILFLSCAVSLSNGRLMQLVLLNNAPMKHGAMCLDGTPPGFYFRPGFNSGKLKWIIQLQGGGFCLDASDCATRSDSFLGSTKGLVPGSRSSRRRAGILTDVWALNPDFYNWNMVHVIYCDGSAYASYREEPLIVDGKTLYFRGFSILNAVLDALLNMGMKRATDIILTGCSAGGLATLIHADHVRESLPQDGVHFAVMSDSGIFPELLEFSASVERLFNFHNMSGGVDEGCREEHAPHNEEWLCYFAQYVIPHVNSSIFAVNSYHDTGSPLLFFRDCLSFVDCGHGELSQVLATLREEFLSASSGLRARSDSGYFFNSCLRHCQSTDDTWFSSVRVEGQLVRETFANWYFGRSAKTKLMDCEKYPCNDSCGRPRDALGIDV